MNTPNLFSFATSELSQDAFLAWLLSWADPEHASQDKELHRCAQNLVRCLFEKSHKVSPEIQSLRVLKQYCNIDILCVVNEQYYIIIEDKTSSRDHSDQLCRYAEEISNNQQVSEENILKIYLKTFDQSCYHDIREKGYAPVLRSDLLGLLRECSSQNDILLHFREHIEALDAEFQQYATLKKDSPLWGQFVTWMGFYQYLQSRLLSDELLEASSYDASDAAEECWHIVNNAQGGFVAFFWGGCDLHDAQGVNGCAFMQLEHGKFAFKTGWAERDSREQFYRVHESLTKQSPLILVDGTQIPIVKPARMVLSKDTATVAILDGGYLQFKADDTLDLDKTYEVIKAAMGCMKLVESC